ncbi:hypothetical protein L9F63_012195, partial [Diploptera punctata]
RFVGCGDIFICSTQPDLHNLHETTVTNTALNPIFIEVLSTNYIKSICVIFR